jgi:Coenzyme PQQ synthesis protein D (PqqD)
MTGSHAKIPEHVAHRQVGTETVLLNLESGQYHGLNLTGGLILRALEEHDGSISRAAEVLAQESGVALETVAADVDRFCAELAERGLVEISEAPPPG